MPVTIYIPTPFRRATGHRDRVEVVASTVAAALDELDREHRDLRGLLRDERGTLHHHVNIYVNSAAIEDLQGLDTALRDGDEVAIIPALAGGARGAGADLRSPAGPPPATAWRGRR